MMPSPIIIEAARGLRSGWAAGRVVAEGLTPNDAGAAAANDAALAAAYLLANNLHLPLVIDTPGVIYLSQPFVIQGLGVDVLGTKPIGANRDNTTVTTLKQVTADADAITISGFIRFLRVADLQIEGPGVGISTGVGINAGSTAGHNGDYLVLDRCYVQGFAVGVRCNSVAQVEFTNLLVGDCTTDYHILGTYFNSGVLRHCNGGPATTHILLDADGQGGVTLIACEAGQCDTFISQYAGNVTVLGGNFEACLGSAYATVDGGGRLAWIGTRFRRVVVNGGLDVPITIAGTQCEVTLVNVERDPSPSFTAAWVLKSSNDADVYATQPDVTVETTTGSVFSPAGAPQAGSYTVATLPPAAARQGGMVLVTNEAGGSVLAYSDGTSWRRVTDRAVVS